MATITHGFSRLKIYGAYSLVALFILGPLLKTGYVFALDLVFTPKFRTPSLITSSYLLHLFFRILNYGIPSQIIEKGVLFAIILLAGTGTYKVIQLLDNQQNTYKQIGAFVAGLFYILNPFTYDRFMTGQYNVLLGYALMPWFTKAILCFINNPSRNSAFLLATMAIITSILSIHAIGFMVLVSTVTLFVYGRKQRSDRIWRTRIVRYGSLAIAIFLIASSYWLLPLVLGVGRTATTINNIGQSDMVAFSTVGGNWLGKLGNIVRLQGYWAEPRGMYILPQSHYPFMWGVIFLLILLLIAGGMVNYWRNNEHDVLLSFSIIGLIAGIIAIGIFDNWLSEIFPLFAGYREPEKFVTLIALAYAIFIARGVSILTCYSHKHAGVFYLGLATVLILLLPFVWIPTMCWGFNNQLTTADYPSDWYIVNQRLNTDKSNFQTLFLPWHLYMYFGFAGRIMANPAPAFFDKPVIVSDNPEYKKISFANSTPTKRRLDQVLPHASTQESLGTQLAKLNIKYIILDKDDDYLDYSYLGNRSDIKLVADNTTLELYVNKAWRKP